MLAYLTRVSIRVIKKISGRPRHSYFSRFIPHLIRHIKRDTTHNPYPTLNVFILCVKTELQLTSWHNAPFCWHLFKHLLMLIFWFCFHILVPISLSFRLQTFCRSLKKSCHWCWAYTAEWIKQLWSQLMIMNSWVERNDASFSDRKPLWRWMGYSVRCVGHFSEERQKWKANRTQDWETQVWIPALNRTQGK